MSAWEAGQCSLACYSSLSCPGEPSYPLTPPALFVTRMPGREAGSKGQGLYTPSTGKGHHRGLVGPLRDDREVRGPLGCRGVKPVEPLLKHSSACYPTQRKGPGSPSANWYYQCGHHLWAKHRQAQPYTQWRHIWACVLMYVHLYNQAIHTDLQHTHANTHTHAQSGCIPEPLFSASVQCWALQPWGEAPAS